MRKRSEHIAISFLREFIGLAGISLFVCAIFIFFLEVGILKY